LRLKSNQPITKGVISANDPPKAAVDLYNKALESVKDGNRKIRFSLKNTPKAFANFSPKYAEGVR
jgi:hypothetical protein